MAGRFGSALGTRSGLLRAGAGVALAVFAAGPAGAGEIALTIYNSDFALVKETRTLALQAGVNESRFTNVTSLLEPDSVVLRDRKDPEGLRILEQNYEGDPLSEASMLRLSEGKTLQFRNVNPATGAVEIVSGRLIRAGYGGGDGWEMRRHGGQPFGVATNPLSPIVEIGGKVLFSLPGQPLFEPPGKDAILKPTLLWRLQAAKGGDRDVEVSYLTGGMRWEATYNLVAPEQGDQFDLVGWVTLENESGAEFQSARVKLMAGDVSKVQPAMAGMAMEMKSMRADMAAPPVTEKAFDEYHLYTLTNPMTLREREVKQVEFCRAARLPGKRLYVYDGAQVPAYAYGGGMAQQPDLGAQSNPKVATMLEFRNSKEAGLGIPLPKGTMKMYRADSDGSREFIGESVIDHTPTDETVRLTVGNAFDLRGERRQTDFKVDSSRQTATEAFEIKVRNHKKEAVEVRIVEHLYRWSGWKIGVSSVPYEKVDARTIEFKVTVPPDGEKVVTCRVNYSW
jgi:hypothetical protein